VFFYFTCKFTTFLVNCKIVKRFFDEVSLLLVARKTGQDGRRAGHKKNSYNILILFSCADVRNDRENEYFCTQIKSKKVKK